MKLQPEDIIELENQLQEPHPWACGLSLKLCNELIHNFTYVEGGSYDLYLHTCILFLLEAHDSAT